MRLSKSPKRRLMTRSTFAWEFVIALAISNYWSPDGQLEGLNKAKEESSLRAVTLPGKSEGQDFDFYNKQAATCI